MERLSPPNNIPTTIRGIEDASGLRFDALIRTVAKYQALTVGTIATGFMFVVIAVWLAVGLSKPPPVVHELSVTADIRRGGGNVSVLKTRVNNDRAIIVPLPTDKVVVERNTRVEMSDGTVISVDFFRPRHMSSSSNGRVPIVAALTSYDKSMRPEDYIVNGRGPLNRARGVDFGDFRVSEVTAFEAPDPAFWVVRGYAVMYVDARGTGASSGKRDPFGETTVRDFCHVITWASRLPWCNGKVGTLGTSYLGAIQWLVAAQNPEGLAAIVPWEGFTDRFRDVAFNGGIPETSFAISWMKGPGVVESEEDLQDFRREPTFMTRLPWIAYAPLPKQTKAQLLYLKGVTSRPSELGFRDAVLENIVVPLLVAASWSAQGLHSRGSFIGYMRCSTPVEHKWMFTHGRHEWTVMNSDQAHMYQLAFFERYLKGNDDAMVGVPHVRLEIRTSTETYIERDESEWPIARTRYVPLYLDPIRMTMSKRPLPEPSVTQYNSTRDDALNFAVRFDTDTEVTGHAKLRLWVACDVGRDMDVFVALRKIDADGRLVDFHNLLGRYPVVSRGWLRVSERGLDASRSTDWLPVLAHEQPMYVVPGERIPVDIEILPSSTLFEAGSTLVLTIKGRDIVDNPINQHKLLWNQGRHSVWCGGQYDSHLLLPVL